MNLLMLIILSVTAIVGIVVYVMSCINSTDRDWKKHRECTCYLKLDKCTSRIEYKDGVLRRKGMAKCGISKELARKLRENLETREKKEAEERKKQHIEQNRRRFAGSRLPPTRRKTTSVYDPSVGVDHYFPHGRYGAGYGAGYGSGDSGSSRGGSSSGGSDSGCSDSSDSGGSSSGGGSDGGC